MAKAGRPRIEIDFAEFEKLCAFQCTLVEIAEWFKVSEDTIERRVLENYGMNFAEIYKKYSSKGKMSLRRLQFRLAEKSASMAIFLGKQYLGQRDQHEVLEKREDVDIDVLKTEIRQLVKENGFHDAKQVEPDTIT